MVRRWWEALWAVERTGSTPADEVTSDAHLSPAPLTPLHRMPPNRLFSEHSLRRAWLAVKRAGGGAGVDGITLDRFAADLDRHLADLRGELAAGRYRPQPVRRILVPKSNGGLRPLALWALRDRVAQRAVYDLISPYFETIFLPCSYGYRPGLSVEDAIGQVIRYRDRNLRWVVDADLDRCFDSIDVRLLEKLIGRRIRHGLLRQYLRGWLCADILNSADGVPQQAGTSQGSVLSPLLANVYLHEFDQELTRRKLALVRYADDFVICCRRKSEAQAAQQTAEKALARLHLSFNEHKGAIVHFDQGFSYLGYFLVRRECYRL